jgi:hypothetical protein
MKGSLHKAALFIGARPPSADSPPEVVAVYLEISKRGGAIIRFTDASAVPQPMEWAMDLRWQGKAAEGPAFACLPDYGEAGSAGRGK